MTKRVFGVPNPVVSMVMATVSLTALLGVVVGAAPATEPSAAPAPAPWEDSGYLRPLSDVIWGFLYTVLSCIVAVWSIFNHTMSERRDKVFFLSVAIFSPVYGLCAFIAHSLEGEVRIWRFNQLCRNSSQPRLLRGWYGHLNMLWSFVSPFSKSQGRILLHCDVVVYVRKESPLLQEKWLWWDFDLVDLPEDLSEVMVIGGVAVGMTQNDHYERKGLTFAGKAAFVLAGVMPENDLLKFLRINWGMATIGFVVLAHKYIHAVVLRVEKDLPVAPLEVVGLIWNIIMVMEVVAFCFLNPCHRPLVIYLDSWEEEKVLEKMVLVKEQHYPRSWVDKWLLYSVEGLVCVGLGGIVVYFIVLLSKVSSIFVVGPLIILVVAIVTLLACIVCKWNHTILSFGILLSIVAYIWAFVVTIVYWKSQHFNAQAKLLNVS